MIWNFLRKIIKMPEYMFNGVTNMITLPLNVLFPAVPTHEYDHCCDQQHESDEENKNRIHVIEYSSAN
jgi:hypothetical protein